MSEVQNSTQSAAGASSAVALNEGLGGILGVKAGMTQVFDENGNSIAVTVIDVRPNVVTQVKTKEKDGYRGVQVGFLNKNSKKANRSEKGRLKASGADGFYHYQELRFPGDAKLEGVEPGKTLSPEFVKTGDFIDVTSVSKGKGFQGVMKRHHFGGGNASHGNSIAHRMPGSIGANRRIGCVLKGKKMAGQMGNKRVTTQNLKVFSVDATKNIILVRGSVPGPRTGIVTIKRAIKKSSGKTK